MYTSPLFSKLMVLLLIARCASSAKVRGPFRVAGTGVTNCYAARQADEARGKCRSILSGIQETLAEGTAELADVCNYAYKSFADAGIYFNPDEHVLTRQKSWPDNARSCSFGIDVFCCVNIVRDTASADVNQNGGTGVGTGPGTSTGAGTGPGTGAGTGAMKFFPQPRLWDRRVDICARPGTNCFDKGLASATAFCQRQPEGFTRAVTSDQEWIPESAVMPIEGRCDGRLGCLAIKDVTCVK